MHENELREAYKEAKRMALEIFEKVAVGEIRNDFIKQLKAKMN